MSSLINLSIKGKDGYKNYTISISDETNQYGQNVVMYEQQSKEERENKVPKKYIGNGSVIWNDGKITNAEKKEVNNSAKVEQKDESLPF